MLPIWPPRLPVAVCLLAVLFSGPGCWRLGGLSKVDRQVEDLIGLGGSGLSDTSDPPPYGDTFRTRSPTEIGSGPGDKRSPPTADPDARDLKYNPADGDPQEEARAVDARLSQYATVIGGGGSDGTPSIELDLATALRIGLLTSRELEIAQEDYILSAIAVLLQRRVFTPRVFNTSSVNFDSVGDDGRFDSTVQLLNQLGVTRNLENGGQIAASWLVQSTEDLRTGVQNSSSASQLVLSGEIPLLRGAGRIARENLIQAERDLIYAARTFERFRRSLLVSFAEDYFNLLQARANIRNQQRQLDSFRALAEQTRARVEAGRLEDFQRAIAESQVLGAQASLAGLRESYIVSLDAFKIRLGIELGTPVDVLPVVIDLDGPVVTLNSAVEAALRYRLDLQTTRDQIVDAERGVENARNGLLPDLGLTGSLTIPTDNDSGPRQGLGLDADEIFYSGGLSLSLPLDRDDQRLAVRQSQITLERARRVYTLARDNVVLAARQAVRLIDLNRFQLRLAQEQVRINERRVKGQEINKDSIEPQVLVDTQNDLINAQNDFEAALTDLRVAVLEFLLDTGQLRVGDDGLLEPLDGMVIRRVGADQSGTDADEPTDGRPDEPVDAGADAAEAGPPESDGELSDLG